MHPRKLINLEQFIIKLPEIVPEFCESLLFTDLDDNTDIGRLHYLITTLHRESFCNYPVDIMCGELFMDTLWSSVSYYKDRINCLHRDYL